MATNNEILCTGLILGTKEVRKWILFWWTSSEDHSKCERFRIFLEKGNILKYWPAVGRVELATGRTGEEGT